MSKRSLAVSITCPTCGTPITATFCGVVSTGPTAETARALEDIMLASHRRLAGCAAPPAPGLPTA